MQRGNTKLRLVSKSIAHSHTDSHGITWRYQVRPLMSPSLIAAARKAGLTIDQLQEGAEQAAFLVFMRTIAAEHLEEVVSATGADGLPVTVELDGVDIAVTAPELRVRLVDLLPDLALAVGTCALKGGSVVEIARGNSEPAPV